LSGGEPLRPASGGAASRHARSAGPRKICVLCGENVADRPRLKDAQGRYACRACIEKRRPERAGKPAARTRGDDDPLAVLAALEASAHAGDAIAGLREMKACPVCERIVGDDQVICLNCGADVTTGRKSKTRVHDRAAGAPPPPPTALRLALAALLAITGAGAGLGIWLAAAQTAGHSVHTMVFVVGALTGGLALVPLRGDGRLVPAIACAAVALAVCVAGLRLSPPDAEAGFVWSLSFADPYGEGTITEEIPVAGLDPSQRAIFAGVWAMLGSLTAFAIGGSSPFDRDEEEDGA
jgi:hypothetical protein